MERRCYFCGRPLDRNGLCPVCSQDNPTQIIRRPAPQRSQVSQRPQVRQVSQTYYPYRYTSQQTKKSQARQTGKSSENIILITSCCIAVVVLTFLFIGLGASLVSAKSNDSYSTTAVTSAEVFSEKSSLPVPEYQ